MAEHEGAGDAHDDEPGVEEVPPPTKKRNTAQFPNKLSQTQFKILLFAEFVNWENAGRIYIDRGKARTWKYLHERVGRDTEGVKACSLDGMPCERTIARLVQPHLDGESLTIEASTDPERELVSLIGQAVKLVQDAARQVSKDAEAQKAVNQRQEDVKVC